MKKKITALLLLIVLLLTACNSGGKSSETKEEKISQEESRTQQEKEDTKQEAKEEMKSEKEDSAKDMLEALTIAITKEQNTLSPFTYISGLGLTVNRLIYDTLFAIDLENKIIPWMVEDDYRIEDSKVFTFKLKEGLKFHNGNPVTPEDIRFSFTYPITQKMAAQRKIANMIEKIDLLDDRTIRFTLKEANVNFMRDGFAYIRIIDDATYQGKEDAATVTETIGSGMYRLAEYKIGEYYKLEAVPDYFRGKPRVKTINMPIITDNTAIQQALLAGELAASTGNIGREMIPTFQANSALKVFSNPGYAPMIININNGRKPFDQSEFRNAIAYAVDVNGICEVLYGDYALRGTKGAVRSDLPYAASGLEYEYNPDKAIEILEKLGYQKINEQGIRVDKEGNPLSFEIITYAGNTDRSRASELVKEQLKKVGVEIEIKMLDMDTADTYIWPNFEVSEGRDYDISTWGWSNTNTMTFLISLFASDFEIGTFNVCGYKNDEFDALLKETMPKITSEEEMQNLLKELQAIIAKDIPLLTIGYPDALQTCNIEMYDGWKSGHGANVVNIFSFLEENDQ